jgi:hypothetical protein
MNVTAGAPLTEAAMQALDPAMTRGGHDWVEVIDELDSGQACLWRADGLAWLITRPDNAGVIEAIAAGGKKAGQWAKLIEQAIRAHPAHKGRRLRIWGRHGWRRYFPDWELVGVENGMSILESEN